MILPGIFASRRRGAAAPATSAYPPVVIGTSGTNGNASSHNLSVPAGAVEGDTFLVFVGGNWAVNSIPAGWTYLAQDPGTNWQGQVFYGALSATHISNGYITVGTTSSGDAVLTGVAFEGTPTFGTVSTLRYGAPADPRTIDADSSVTAGMMCLMYADAHNWDDIVIDVGAEIATVNVSSDGSSSLNSVVRTVGGAFTVTADYLWGNVGGQYLAVVPVYHPSVPFSAVKALYGFEGAGTYLNDESGNSHTVTPNGSWSFQSAGGVFGDGAGRSGTGASSIGTVAHSDDFIFDGAFTVELWGKSFGGSTVQGLLSKWHNTTDGRSWALNWEYLTMNVEALLSTDGVTTDLALASTTPVTTGTLHHFCLERDDTDTVRLYVNGVMVDSGTLSGALFNNSAIPMEIGGFNGGSARSGTQDEVRITKGFARYASDAGFTVPTEAFPRS